MAVLCALSGAAPATRPSVPALIVGGDALPRSFLVEGILRSQSGGLAFQVATDGRRERTAVYDPADGTPLFLSDGQQTLVYDVAKNRVVRVAVSRGNVRVDWFAEKEKPLNFAWGVQFSSSATRLADHNSYFRIDKLVASPRGAMVRETIGADVERFVVVRGEQTDAVTLKHGDASWFGFKSGYEQTSETLELTASHINQPVPESALAFPDVERMPAETRVTELEESALPLFLVFLRDGRAFMAKMVLAGGPISAKEAEQFMPGVNWDELRERDRTFGAAYRTALAEQGVRLKTFPRLASQPTRNVAATLPSR
jgi:hypothetical protein